MDRDDAPTDRYFVDILLPYADTTVKAALPPIGRTAFHAARVPLDTLTGNLQEFVAHFQSAFDKDKGEDATFVLDEVELSLELTANGGVALIGKIEAGAAAAIKVKLKRKP